MSQLSISQFLRKKPPLKDDGPCPKYGRHDVINDDSDHSLKKDQEVRGQADRSYVRDFHESPSQQPCTDGAVTGRSLTLN